MQLLLSEVNVNRISIRLHSMELISPSESTLKNIDIIFSCTETCDTRRKLIRCTYVPFLFHPDYIENYEDWLQTTTSK